MSLELIHEINEAENVYSKKVERKRKDPLEYVIAAATKKLEMYKNMLTSFGIVVKPINGNFEIWKDDVFIIVIHNLEELRSFCIGHLIAGVKHG